MPGTRTVLIVDDSKAVCSMLQSYLSRFDEWDAVLVANDAGQGLLLASHQQPDGIVLDNRMPGGDGIDVLAQIRRACPDARIVMHTTEDTIDLREQATRLGADAFVPKGASLDELAAELTGATSP